MKKLILLLSIAVFCLQACETSNNTANKTKINTKTNTATSTNSATNKNVDKAPHVVQWEIDHPKMLNYIKNNKIDAKWLESGLYYAIINQGSGIKPTNNSTVNVSYALSDLEGRKIWSTDQAEGSEIRTLSKFPPGVVEGLQLIQAGGRIQLIVPSALAYGAKGWGKQIAPNTNLFYDIQLNSVQ